MAITMLYFQDMSSALRAGFVKESVTAYGYAGKALIDGLWARAEVHLK